MEDADTTAPEAAGDTPQARRAAKAAEAAAKFLNRAKPGDKAAPKAAAKAPAKKAAPARPLGGSPAKKAASAPAAAAPEPRPAAAAAPARRTPPPAEQEKVTFYSARINLTTTEAQKKALKLAGVEDGIDTTARIRAMISLWEEDERLRRRIDKAAQHWR